MKRFVGLSLIIYFMLFVSPVALFADGKSIDVKKTTWGDIIADVVGHYPIKIDQFKTETDRKGTLNIPKNWEFDIGMQRFILSHTSYEFGNPDAPFQKPLSRLEFPLNTWWLDLKLRRTCPRWSIGGRAGFAVNPHTDGGLMKDSDWENVENTDMLTTYSKSQCEMEKGYLFRGDVDVNISDWFKLPRSLEIRPLFAFQFQRFFLMAHDGMQWSNGSYDVEEAEYPSGDLNSTPLPGDMIHFQQDYYIYLIGLRGSYELLRLGKNLMLKINGEADWGPVLGYNQDYHVQREGSRFTYEKTSGNALYFSAGLDMIIAKDITAGLKMDYMWIRTTGVHRMSNIPLGQDQTWPDGVKVWSDQTSLTAHISYAF